MSSSTREGDALGAKSLLGGERLAELLCAIAEARDDTEAGYLLLAEVLQEVGAERGCLLEMRGGGQPLRLMSCFGFADADPQLEIGLEDTRNPLLVSALSLRAVVSDGQSEWRPLDFESWTAIPYPRPVDRHSAAPLPEQRAVELLDGSRARLAGADRTLRLGHAPGGVILIEGIVPSERLAALTRAVSLAGPVLARISAVEEYRRSALRLDQQRDLLAIIVNSLPDPIVITDANNDIVVQNSRAEHLLTFAEGDSEGRRRAVEINNLLFTSFLSRAVMTGGVQSGSRELNLVDPDEGTDLLFEVLAHPLGGEVSRSSSFISVLRDVTDLRRASNELERQVQRVRLAEITATREKDRLNLILENVADPILVTDDRSNIILMNQQAEQLFDAGDAEATVNRVRARAVRDNDTKFTTFVSDFIISRDQSRREQMRLVHPGSGKELPVEVVSGKILNPRGEALAIVSVLHDLTKQVENERLYEELKQFSGHLEERVRTATADLAEQNARLQWQSRELERANRLKSEFLASMSHELRTPINALIGYTSLMLDRIYGDLTEKQEEGLHRIQASAHHLLALINDILDLAKIEAGKMPLHVEPVEIQPLVDEITQQVEPLVRKRSLTFMVEMPDEPPEMYTDRVKVKQILLNLLSNAVKFTHTGHVALAIIQDGRHIRFEIRDTGIGIEAKDLEAIWEDFRQLDQSRTREYGGTGLGLSITRKLVGRLGGTITVQSTYGSGSTFAVRLPVRTSATLEGSRPGAMSLLPGTEIS